MAKKMLIDAAHPEETRVCVLDGHRVDDFDFETAAKRQLRGNIYLAKVTRVEPSLQAAFVEYGGNRHGFLAFSEIHPDYYQIPLADREALKAEFDAAADEVAQSDSEDDEAELEERRRRILARRYRIQEVIKRRQIMLIQVVKEERGSKGAALTTYLSLAGRYCVLMPNTGRGGGISRKITNAADRKRLKKVATDLDVPTGMGLIIRTAGAKRTKTEIKRDYEYLIRAWESIRDTTMRSVAPALIYEESSLVKRAIRDLYDKDVDEVHVEGEGAYREAKDFVRMLMPSHAKKVHMWKGDGPILSRHGVERQLESVYSPVVPLKSGGYLVINQTEALVSIDVNSGRSTREKNIENTALRTNLEAAEEAARQMRLRDLAGLIVIDFIDMEETRNDKSVEKKMKDALRLDRARVQMGKISGFGLLELSRQRRRTGILEGSSHVCQHCQGTGRIRSIESSALKLLRTLEEECVRRPGAGIEVHAPTDVAVYVLNEKRATLARLETQYEVRLRLSASSQILTPDFEIQVHERAPELDADGEPIPRKARPAPAPMPVYENDDADVADEPDEVEEAEGEEETIITGGDGGDAAGRRGRRRRGRRGGKKRRDEMDGGAEGESAQAEAGDRRPQEQRDDRPPREDRGERGGRRRRRRRSRRAYESDAGEHLDFLASALPQPQHQAQPQAEAEGAPAEGEVAPAREPREPREGGRGRGRDRRRRGGDRAERTETPALVSEAVDAPDTDETPAQAPAPAPTPAPTPVMAASAPEPEPVAVAELPTALPGQLESDIDYAPDRERREKFFARLSKWGKKG
jgi:ribonuclease E